MAKEINKVLVVGAGTMGSGIAQVFAGSGFKTTMADLKPEFIARAYENIGKNIAGMKEGLADTIDQLHILQSGEGYFAQSLVKYHGGIALTAQSYEVFGQQKHIAPVLFEEFAASLIDVYSLERMPPQRLHGMVVEWLHRHAVARLLH